MTTVAFLGLGRMGVRMAAHLVDDYDLVVWNRTASRADPLAARGAAVAPTVGAAVDSADVIISMLADDDAVRRVYLVDGDSIVRHVQRSAVAIDMSTVSPATVADVDAALAARGARFLDSPVSGSIDFAERAELITMVGGGTADIERVRPFLSAMTRASYHVGPTGSGAVMKLAINSIIGATNEAIAEALVLAERAGIERAAAYDVMADSAVASPFLKYKQASFVDPDNAPQGFTCRLLQKDLDLIHSLARDVGAAMPQLAAANEVLSMAIGAGWGEHDLNRVADLLRTVSAQSRQQPGA